MCKVITIQNKLLQSCSYFVESHGLWLIDCGDYLPIATYIKQSGKELKGIFLTHCHQDHIYGLNDVLMFYPNTKIYCSQLTAQGLSDEKMNLSYIIPEYPFKFEYETNVVVVKEGKRDIEGLDIEVLSTPGHSDDCLTYIIGKNIFTGDSYIPFAKVFTKWPRSNKQLALMHEQRLKELIERRKFNVNCGHWQ